MASESDVLSSHPSTSGNFDEHDFPTPSKDREVINRTTHVQTSEAKALGPARIFARDSSMDAGNNGKGFVFEQARQSGPSDSLWSQTHRVRDMVPGSLQQGLQAASPTEEEHHKQTEDIDMDGDIVNFATKPLERRSEASKSPSPRLADISVSTEESSDKNPVIIKQVEVPPPDDTAAEESVMESVGTSHASQKAVVEADVDEGAVNAQEEAIDAQEGVINSQEEVVNAQEGIINAQEELEADRPEVQGKQNLHSTSRNSIPTAALHDEALLTCVIQMRSRIAAQIEAEHVKERDSLSSELTTLTSKHDALKLKYDTLTLEHKQMIESASHEINSLTAKHEKEMAERSLKVMRELDRSRNEMRSQHEQEIAELRAENTDAIDRLHDKILADLDPFENIGALKACHHSDLVAAQKDLDDARTEIARVKELSHRLLVTSAKNEQTLREMESELNESNEASDKYLAMLEEAETRARHSEELNKQLKVRLAAVQSEYIKQVTIVGTTEARHKTTEQKLSQITEQISILKDATASDMRKLTQSLPGRAVTQDPQLLEAINRVNTRVEAIVPSIDALKHDIENIPRDTPATQLVSEDVRSAIEKHFQALDGKIGTNAQFLSEQLTAYKASLSTVESAVGTSKDSLQATLVSELSKLANSTPQTVTGPDLDKLKTSVVHALLAPLKALEDKLAGNEALSAELVKVKDEVIRLTSCLDLKTTELIETTSKLSDLKEQHAVLKGELNVVKKEKQVADEKFADAESQHIKQERKILEAEERMQDALISRNAARLDLGVKDKVLLDAQEKQTRTSMQLDAVKLELQQAKDSAKDYSPVDTAVLIDEAKDAAARDLAGLGATLDDFKKTIAAETAAELNKLKVIINALTVENSALKGGTVAVAAITPAAKVIAKPNFVANLPSDPFVMPRSRAQPAQTRSTTDSGERDTESSPLSDYSDTIVASTGHFTVIPLPKTVSEQASQQGQETPYRSRPNSQANIGAQRTQSTPKTQLDQPLTPFRPITSKAGQDNDLMDDDIEDQVDNIASNLRGTTNNSQRTGAIAHGSSSQISHTPQAVSGQKRTRASSKVYQAANKRQQTGSTANDSRLQAACSPSTSSTTMGGAARVQSSRQTSQRQSRGGGSQRGKFGLPALIRSLLTASRR